MMFPIPSAQPFVLAMLAFGLILATVVAGVARY